MSQRLFFLAGWVLLAFIVFVTLCPLRDRPIVAGAQLEHFAAFALIGFAFIRGQPNRPLMILTMVVTSAFALEALQLITPDRHGRIVDALVKAAGGLCGIGIGYMLPVLLAKPIDRLKASFGRQPS